MLWFLIWTVLVLATLGGGFLLGRDLWRKGKALAVEVGRAGELARALEERTAELTAAGQAHEVTHDLFTDRSVVLARRAELHDAKDRRRAARRVRHEQTMAGWRAYSR